MKGEMEEEGEEGERGQEDGRRREKWKNCLIGRVPNVFACQRLAGGWSRKPYPAWNRAILRKKHRFLERHNPSGCFYRSFRFQWNVPGRSRGRKG